NVEDGAVEAARRRPCPAAQELRPKRPAHELRRRRARSAARRMARPLLREPSMSLVRFKSTLATIDPSDTVEKAAREMRDRSVGCLVVTHAGHPVGVVTDRDIVIRAVAEGRAGAHDRIGDFVTYDPVTVSLDEGIETAVARMRKHGVRRLPLVD